MNKTIKWCFFTLGALTLLQAGVVRAGVIVQCGAATCSSAFQVFKDGQQMGGGELIYDAASGDISLSQKNISGNGVVTASGGIMWNLGNNNLIRVDSLSGNADPILGFGLGASTGAAGSTYAFAFNLPIALSGTINTGASVSYSLTSLTDTGAQIKGIGGNKVVQSWDIDSSVGGLPDLNKNVDVGDTYFHLGGPIVSNSPVYSATGTITGDPAYDLMAVQVAFTLSENSSVGISGFVSQTPAVVPVPAAAWLMFSGVGLLGLRARRASV